MLTFAFQVVSPLKDVEGLHFKFHYNLYHKYALRFYMAVNTPRNNPQHSVSEAGIIAFFDHAEG